MTDVIYTDTPNDPTHPLALGPLEPIGLTCTKALSYLAVQQDDLVEVAFMDDAFTPAYAGHSTIDGARKVATVLRAGGWLGPPRLMPRFAGGGGLPMGAIYEVDFRTLPTQSLMAAGSHVVDGLTWCAKGSLGTRGGRTEVINGSGLRLYWPAAANYPADYNSWRSSVGWTFKRALVLPLGQVPGYNPLAPLAILCRMTSNNSMAVSVDGFSNPVGVMDAVLDANPITDPEYQTQMSLIPIASTATWWTSLGNADTRNPGGANVGASLGSYVFGLYRMLEDRWYPLLGPWTGALTVPDDYVSGISNAGDFVMPTRCSDTPSFLFTFEYSSGTSVVEDNYLTHLKIMQPRF